MEHLTLRDLDRFNRAILILRSAHDMQSLPRRIVDAARSVVNADLIAVDDLSWKGLWLKNGGVDPPDSFNEETLKIFDYYAHEHPLLNNFHQTGNSDPRRISDVLSLAHFRRLGIYNEFFRRIGVDCQLGVVAPVSPELTLCIAAGRSGSDYTELDCCLFKLLQPHLILSCREAEAHALAQNSSDNSAASQVIGECIVELRKDGDVKEMSKQAWQLLERYFDVPPRPPIRLPTQLERWCKYHLRFVVRLGDTVLPVEPLVAQQEQRSLEVRLLYNYKPDQAALLLTEKQVSLMPLKKLGLTARDIEILYLLTQGLTNNEIADELNIEGSTVKTHIEKMFDRLTEHGVLKVRKRAALAKLAAEKLRACY